MVIDVSPALLRLLQLSSPSLPVGAYSFSQGLEWAVEDKLVSDESTFRGWISDIMTLNLGNLDAPVLGRMYDGWIDDDLGVVNVWNEFLYASRETKELRDEDSHLGRALAKLVAGLGLPCPEQQITMCPTFAMLYSMAAVRWEIPKPAMISGYLWAWLESQVLAGIKLVPLGQLAGQRIFLEVSGYIPSYVERALTLKDEAIGFSLPMVAIASSRHETQYSRLFCS